MIAAGALRPAATESRSSLIAWISARPWVWVVAIFALWSLAPGFRRLVDWKSGFSAISLLSILPLASIVPALISLIYRPGRLARIDPRLLMLAWAWFGGFTFALAITVATHAAPVAAAAYTFSDFCLPAAFGLWVASIDVPLRELYDRVASFMLWLITPLSIYGAFQFVAPPRGTFCGCVTRISRRSVYRSRFSYECSAR